MEELVIVAMSAMALYAAIKISVDVWISFEGRGILESDEAAQS